MYISLWIIIIIIIIIKSAAGEVSSGLKAREEKENNSDLLLISVCSLITEAQTHTSTVNTHFYCPHTLFPNLGFLKVKLKTIKY